MVVKRGPNADAAKEEKECPESEADESEHEESGPDSSDSDSDPEELAELEIPSPEAINVGDFVVTKFLTKKAMAMYVGQIQERLISILGEYKVKFLRREKASSVTFVFPEVNDCADVLLTDIVGRLPQPAQHGGTARVACHLSFPVNLSFYDKSLR